MLTAAQEQALAMRIVAGDKSAQDELVENYVFLAQKMAARMCRNNPDTYDDLLSAGYEGLMHAARKFAPDRGARFYTYARPWIRTYMGQSFRKNFGAVRILTNHGQRKVYGGVGKFLQKNPNATRKEIAEHFKATEEDVDLVLNANKYASLDAPLVARGFMLTSGELTAGNNSSATFQSLRADPRPLQDEQYEVAAQFNARSAIVRRAIQEALTPRERYVIQAYALNPNEPAARIVAGPLDITRERMRQIMQEAINKIRAFVAENYEEGERDV